MGVKTGSEGGVALPIDFLGLYDMPLINKTFLL